MTPDPKLNYAGAPVARLGGMDFFVPMLALRQSRIVVPAILRLVPRLDELQQAAKAGAASISLADVDLIIDVVHTALTRAYPAMTRDDLLDREATFPELITAVAIVARQTGLFAAAGAGEAQGTKETQANPPSPISTASSADIATIPASPGPTP